MMKKLKIVAFMTLKIKGRVLLSLLFPVLKIAKIQLYDSSHKFIINNLNTNEI